MQEIEKGNKRETRKEKERKERKGNKRKGNNDNLLITNLALRISE